MMWKESYRLGVDLVDQQHIALFEAADKLMNAIESGAGADQFREVIEFLKDYVVKHFREEEAYQASIHYSGLKAHSEEHRKFTETVLQYEADLIACDFNIHLVKDLAGTLVAWLVYHVAGEDQKFAKGYHEAEEHRIRDSFVNLFADSVREVMKITAGIDVNKIDPIPKGESAAEGHRDICVEIGLTGDAERGVKFCFSKELAFNLFQSMTFMEPTELDELVQSAVSELTNIACGHASTAIAESGKSCDITTPTVSLENPAVDNMQGMHLDTEAGRMEVFVTEK